MTRGSPPDASSDTPLVSPDCADVEQPRLSIIHLLGWTACVAVYFSVLRTTAPPNWGPRGLSLFVAIAMGIGSGTALGGLMLAAARRYRGLPFPSQPGERLVMVLGIAAAVNMGYYTIEAFEPYVTAYLLLSTLLLVVLYGFAARAESSARWRAYFIMMAALTTNLVTLLVLPFSGSLVYNSPPNLIWISTLLPQFSSAVAMLYIAWKDSRQGACYRWTHWLGIYLVLWNDMIMSAWAAWRWLAGL
jgi:hypothetical protein